MALAFSSISSTKSESDRMFLNPQHNQARMRLMARAVAVLTTLMATGNIANAKDHQADSPAKSIAPRVTGDPLRGSFRWKTSRSLSTIPLAGFCGARVKRSEGT
jgi:hypothetical protein